MLLWPSQLLRFPAADRFRRRPSAVARRMPSLAIRATAPSCSGAPAPTSRESHSVQISQSSLFPLHVNSGCRRNPELGLASILFVLSMIVKSIEKFKKNSYSWVNLERKVLGSFFSLLIISLPALHAFRKLAASSAKLSKVLSKEVPGTLLSLKLSGLEINDLTRQLNNLKLRVFGERYVKYISNVNPGFHGGRRDKNFS